MIERDQAAFIEVNTAKAVPYLLEALRSNKLKPEQVAYIIITHVHLDHAGGVFALLKKCPNAIVLAHPLAARHLTYPKLLSESVRTVFGKDFFEQHYGRIEPVNADRVRSMMDGETLEFGGRSLTFIHTRGHANHHFSVFDSRSGAIFTGDSFGASYPFLKKGERSLLFPLTPPTDFNPEEARISVNKILASGAELAYLTHFGVWPDMQAGAHDMLHGLNWLEQILMDAERSELEGEALEEWCHQNVIRMFDRDLAERGINLSEDERKFLSLDLKINAAGLAHAAARRKWERKNKKTTA
jgi:glyoxylase-like metal-dependent hydrolase (beta-lactamase superfamily II)